ncbi:Far-red impaired responsive (FAR1) family protein [Abeliophyllum distichum]|uniref:Far-red impaired responsive (FAR1) family protein n=1 Tax=Abeliophyllum distichum TaxID=126358 RepID=A0ABD1QKI2_9LAMI
MESGSGDNVYVPQVAEHSIPTIGQEFPSHEAAYTFYNQYPREAGFSARIENSKKNKVTNEIYWKLFVCSKERQPDDTYQRKHKDSVPRAGERKRGQTRVGCLDRLAVVKQQTGQIWIVKKFVEEPTTIPVAGKKLAPWYHPPTTEVLLENLRSLSGFHGNLRATSVLLLRDHRSLWNHPLFSDVA